MKFLAAVGFYFLIALSVLQNWLLVGFVLVMVFSYLYGASMLIPLAFLIDGYFGNFASWPYLSVFSVFWYLLVEYIRPKVARLNDSD